MDLNTYMVDRKSIQLTFEGVYLTNTYTNCHYPLWLHKQNTADNVLSVYKTMKE